MIEGTIKDLVDVTACNFANFLHIYYTSEGCPVGKWMLKDLGFDPENSRKDTGFMHTTEYALEQYRIFTKQTLDLKES